MKKKWRFTVEDDSARNQWEIWAIPLDDSDDGDIAAFFSQNYFQRSEVENIRKRLTRKCQ